MAMFWYQTAPFWISIKNRFGFVEWDEREKWKKWKKREQREQRETTRNNEKQRGKTRKNEKKTRKNEKNEKNENNDNNDNNENNENNENNDINEKTRITRITRNTRKTRKMIMEWNRKLCADQVEENTGNSEQNVRRLCSQLSPHMTSLSATWGRQGRLTRHSGEKQTERERRKTCSISSVK